MYQRRKQPGDASMQRYMGEMDRERTDSGDNGNADEKTKGDREVHRTTSTRAAAAMRG